MAELLIYRGGHWMDKLSQAKWDEHVAHDAHFAQKYAARYQDGHVVEIRPDGFWSKAGVYPRPDVFRVILLPGVDVKDVNYLLTAGTTERKVYRVTSGKGEDVCQVATLADLKMSQESKSG